MSNTLILLTKAPLDGDSIPTNMPNRMFQATVEGVGAISADFAIEYSNDQKVWFPHDGSPVTVSGNDLASVMLPLVNQGSGWARARCLAISGQDAVASVTMAMM